MFQEADIDLAGLQQLDAKVADDQDLKSSRRKVLTALSSLLDQAEVHRMKSIGRIPSTVRVPGCLSEVEEGLLPFVSDPIGTVLRLGIRRLGEIAAGFMTIDEMTEVTKEAAAECGHPGVREVIVDKQWNGIRDQGAATGSPEASGGQVAVTLDNRGRAIVHPMSDQTVIVWDLETVRGGRSDAEHGAGERTGGARRLGARLPQTSAS